MVEFEPGSIGWTKALTKEITGRATAQISFPGGRGRGSIRAHLDDGTTVIATRRATPEHTSAEAFVMQALHEGGAPVPAVIGYKDGLLVQADMGRNRLSFAMSEAKAADRLAMARAAFVSLEACRKVMSNLPDLLGRLPVLGGNAAWAEEFTSHAFFLSGDLGIKRPACDPEALATSLVQTGAVFTRGDARLGKASLQPDGSVVWYDWNLCGRRGGFEDLGIALSDNYWAIPLKKTLALLDDFVPDASQRQAAIRVAVMTAARRMAYMAQHQAKNGIAPAAETLREDRGGAVQSVVKDLAKRMAALSGEDPLTEGFVDWFPVAAEAMLARKTA